MSEDPDSTVIAVRMPGLDLRVAARTHTGRVRRHNEDALLVDLDLKLMAVADGMGGHDRGEIASRAVLTALVDFLRRHAAGFSEEVVSEALRQANQAVYEHNRRRGYREGTGMGSTVAGLWFGPGRAIRFHVGDSRIYRYRRGRLEQLGRDHSLYQAWLEAGGEGIAPATNILTRSLGCFMEVEPEVATLDCRLGDRFLLCSDGLTRYWTDPRLEAFFASGGSDLSSQVDALVETANERDGGDNITAILISVGEPP